ncbi:MAG: RNA polymerase sigma factor [Acidimicrobiia bacterium]
MIDREIYEEVRGSLMRFAASLVGADDADDVVSEAVVRTLRRGSLASLDNPRAYLMQAVLNAARDRGRRLTRERAAVARHVGMREAVPVVSIDSPELTEAVMRLPVRQRAAIFLVYFEDMAPSDAAELLGVRPGTLRRYLLLARRKLRGWLDE